MLGISVYFKDYDEQYIKEAAAAGAKYVFTSLQIPEEDYSNLNVMLPRFLEVCREAGLQIVPDISPATFEKLGIDDGDYAALRRLGFKQLRLDYGFDDFELVRRLQQDFMIFLNASVVTPEYLSEARAARVDFSEDKVALIYNFYPHTDTGMAWSDLLRRNRALKGEGLNTGVFVAGDVLKRFPMYEGLPTVEKHRGMNPYVAAVQLIHEAGVDNVFIGDSQASVQSLKYITEYQQKHVMCIPCQLLTEYEYLYNEEIGVRADQPEKLVRLLVARKPGVAVQHTLDRRRGSIVMQNRLAQRYSGEVYLIKKNLPFEARSNVIGFVSPEYVDLLDQIDAGVKVKFVGE